MPDNLQSTDFQPLLNQLFKVQLSDDQVMELELVNVTELGAPSQDEGRPPYALHFLGPVSSTYLPQHTYQFQHSAMGLFELFIVPLGAETGRMRYEAIFT